jgi:TolB-like protein/class 3 adenylate cyclase
LKKDLSTSRQLAAIMFTDIVGYTKLMGENEEKAMKLLSRNKAIQKPLVKKYNGRWLKEIGDGTLSSFQSALDAVYCANKIMLAHKDDPNIKIRIGIHIGDVTFSEGDIYGDGVNIASRLEQYAQPNEILISDVVYYNIKNIEGIKVEFLKEIQRKNVNESTRIFRISGEITEQSEENVTSYQEYSQGKRKSPITTVLLISLALVIIVISFFVLKDSSFVKTFYEEPREKTVAVIQFENLGGEDEKAYSIGITEDILIQLMKVKDIKVIQQPPNLSDYPEDKTFKDIGDELGVAHILLGSVWKENNQLRVTAKLVDTKSEQVLWTNGWNKPFEEIFVIESEVAVMIAEALEANITREEVAKIEKRPTQNITAYDLYLKGREYYLRLNEQDNFNAMELFVDALKLDPEFGMAHAGLSDAFSQQAQWSGMAGMWLDSAYYHASIVTENEPDLSQGHKSLGLYYSIIGNSIQAIEAFTKAVEIDNNVDAVINLSRIFFRTGQMNKSLQVLDNARYQHPLNENLLFNYGATYYRLNDFSLANDYLDQALAVNPSHVNSLLLKWFIAVLSGDTESSFSAASRLGYYDTGSIDKVLTLLQKELTNNNSEKDRAARSLRQLLENREFDYIDIPYLYVIIGQVYFSGDMEERALELFNYKITYNSERIEQGEMAYKFYYELAQIYAITGKKDKAYEYLESAVAMGWPEYLFALLDPSFQSMINEDRFQQLIEKSREHVNSIQNSILAREDMKIG